MIAIRNNPNFSNWLQVFSFGKLVDEFTKESDALALASQLAKNTKQTHISLKGEAFKVKK
ncbi:MAG: hypothetical protein EBT51_08345 [Flavobacteriaceae bacterium]|nr:hypothetical protein [Flavobacteriaceae bacterium]